MPNSITVVFPEGEESLSAFGKRIREAPGEVLVVLSLMEESIAGDESARGRFLDGCVKMSGRLRIATHRRSIARTARARGIRVIDRVQDLRKLLQGHPDFEEAIREFQPHIWQQQLRSRLQAMGLLSLPKLRIWALIFLSALLFVFIFFRLLPSATVRVFPRETMISQTVNIFLVQSGATADIPARVRSMELIPITVRVDRSLTFDQISLEFIGENASVAMAVVNDSQEPYWLKRGTRLTNQAGIIFRLRDSVQVEPQSRATIAADADPIDLYGVVVGERGNVPAGLRWDFPGLSREERIFIYAENTAPGTGGVTAYREILSEKDLDIARKKLEQELLTLAKQLADEQVELRNSGEATKQLEILYYEELTKLQYLDFNVPREFIGEPVKSVPISGSAIYTAYAYDTQYVLDLLSHELLSHVGEGERLVPESLQHDRLVAHVIDYDDDLQWIKLTVDLSGTQKAVLDPLSPTGALFAKKVRQGIAGMSKMEAERIVANFPEVEKASITVWPPWSRRIPGIPANIAVDPVME